MSSGGIMEGRKVLVVGASSGLGEATAKAAAAVGADVAVSARREEMLERLVAQMGRGHALAGDATKPEDAKRVVNGAAERMGGLDLVVYAAGTGYLQPLAQCDPEIWASIYKVNVLGANLIAGAAIEHLGREGIMAFISSRTVDDKNTYFGSYGASKAALEHCIHTWRLEHPERRFVRVMMGNCAPTEFANHMGTAFFEKALTSWQEHGVWGGVMQSDDVGRAMIESFAVGLDHPDIDLSELRLDARRDQGLELGEMDVTKV